MNAVFSFAGNECSLYTNGKVYSNGIQYVEVSHGYQKSRGQWDHNSKSWKKRLGNPGFDQAVAEAAGFIKVAPVKKVRAKKQLSPELAAMQLPEGKKAQLVRGKIVVVSVEEKAMTDQEKADEAKWCMMLRLSIKNDARALERKRNLSDQDILDRIKQEDKERYVAAKKLLDAGAYQYR